MSKKYQLNRYNGSAWEILTPKVDVDWESINNKPTNYPPTAHTHNYLPKTTYEYNKELDLSSTGKVCIGKFSMYDSNVTVEISSTTNTTYNGTLVIATQNINDSHGGSYVANVYGDATGTLSSRLVVIYPTNSRVFEIYCDFPTYSKNLVHIKALGLKAEPTNILATVSSIPTTNKISVNNLLTQKLDLKANKSDITSVYKARGSISDVSTIDATMPDGYVYNVTVDFTTNENFVEDKGKTYPAGTNIVKVTVNGSPKWDVLSGMVDLSSYAKTSDLSSYAKTSDLSNKVDKVSGKGLSTNDYTTAEKTKLANLPTAENLSSWEEEINNNIKKALHSEVLYDGEINFERASTTSQTITVAATQSSYKFFVFTGYDAEANAVSFLGSAYGYSTIVVPIELSHLRWEYSQYQTRMKINPTENSTQFTLLKIIGVY